MLLNAPRVAWVALALLLAAASWQSRRLAETRRARLPEAYAGYASDAPPALTFVMAGLGGFRGVVSEVLWFRVNRLQEEGRYLELVQLADWIARLDPHAAEAWIYNAWNLAYNVSIMMVRDEDRLRWVQSGIELLRDTGLRYNPREARLYRELAWLYQNKIGDSLDSAHLTYKLALAQSLAPLLRPDGTVDAAAENRPKLKALRLDAERMLALERRFGPLDWRVAESHALYWAFQGLEFATGSERLLCCRAVYQPLLLCVFRGRFAGDLASRRWQTSPNLALAAASVDFLAQNRTEFPSKTMTTVYFRHMTALVRLFNQAGDASQARSFYDRLIASLGPRRDVPAFGDVLKGWEYTHEN